MVRVGAETQRSLLRGMKMMTKLYKTRRAKWAIIQEHVNTRVVAEAETIEGSPEIVEAASVVVVGEVRPISSKHNTSRAPITTIIINKVHVVEEEVQATAEARRAHGEEVAVPPVDIEEEAAVHQTPVSRTTADARAQESTIK